MRISGTDLEHWADRLDSRATLPILIRRLIHATTDDARFPGGEGIQKPGFDGRVYADAATAYIPARSSVWELGCDKNPKSKANDDYAKRTANPPEGCNPKEHTFVFVTPRRWYDHETWALERSREGVWREVRAYDGDTLEQWLEHAPAVSAWFSDEIGKPRAIQALESYWDEWSARTTPPTSDALVRAGRDDAATTLLSWLAGPPSLLTTQLHDLGEAPAFVCAVARLSERRERLLNRAIVVESDEALRQLAPTEHPLVIVALGLTLGVAKRAARGHHVLLATRNEIPGDRIVLGELEGGAAVAALERMGLGTVEAQHLAREARASLPDLRRRLGDEVPPPDPDLVKLAPLLLVDSWDERSLADVAAVEGVLGVGEPNALFDLVRRFTRPPDALLASDGSVVRWISRRAAWQHLAKSLRPDDVRRFHEALFAAFPRRDVSASLLEGMVEGALLLGSAAEDLGANVLDGPHEASMAVYGVFARLDCLERWVDADRYLPALAEAAPEIFLSRLEKRLDADPDLFAQLFGQDTGRDFSGGRTAVGLVWALQILAWNPSYLSRSAMLLARLAALDPGANAYPRPMSSLGEIFVPWLPHTTADSAERHAAVARIARQLPEVGVRLALDLLAKESTSTTAQPRYRPWCAGWDDQVMTHHVLRTAHGELADLAVATAASNPNLWEPVIRQLHDLPEPHRVQAFGCLATLSRDDLAEPDQERLRATVRTLLHNDLDRESETLREDQRSSLERIYNVLEPESLRRRHAWLFGHAPHLPDVSSGPKWQEHSAALKQRQREAVSELVEALDVNELLDFARDEVESRFSIGWRIGEDEAHEAVARTLMDHSLRTTDSWARELRFGICAAVEEREGRAWLTDLVVDRMGEDLGELLLAMRPRPEVWAQLGDMSSAAARWYWSQLNPGRLQGVLDAGIQNMLSAGRALDVIDVAAMNHGYQGFALQPATIDAILKQAAKDREARVAASMPHLGYHVSKLLNALSEAGEAWLEALAGHEYVWLDETWHNRRPAVLFARIGADPERFVAIVAAAFRGEDESPREPTKEALLNARRASSVLWHWQGVPGITASGVDPAHLRRWIAHARDRLWALGRRDIGDQTIGQVLSHAPQGQDGLWPHEAVRDAIDGLNAVAEIRTGFVIGRRNQRGVTTRSVGEGGDQERSIAASYAQSAEAMRRRWPTTASFLDKLADSYRRDAQEEDVHAQRTLRRFTPQASIKDRVIAFVEARLGSGLQTFDINDIAADLETAAPRNLERELASMVQSGHLASPEPGFYAIVPPERRSTGIPPSWYIDPWMRWKEAPYHVGLLTAAALNGAGHEQPTVFQVVVDRQLEGLSELTVAGTRIEFVVAPYAGGAGTTEVRTQTGWMRISGPERTLFDLVAHADVVGGIDLIVAVTEDLGEVCNRERLAALIDLYPLEVAQRVGWMLNKLQRRRATGDLAKLVKERNPQPIPLRPHADAGGRRGRPPWFVTVETPLERDR